MLNTIRIAWKNLLRYRRRTLLTSMLITVGIVAVLLFISVSSSFKAMMVGQITDSMLGHIQVHKRGYVSSIDSLPLHMNMKPRMVEKVKEALSELDNVEACSERIKFGAMYSNFTETTNIRLNAVVPGDEAKTAPLLAGRIIAGKKEGALLTKGKILIPEINLGQLAKYIRSEFLIDVLQFNKVRGLPLNTADILGKITDILGGNND